MVVSTVVAGAALASPPASRVFTEFVRAAGAAAEVDPEQLSAVLAALRIALRSEMRRRGLWESPPAYLGVFGWDSWSGAAPRRRHRLAQPFAGFGSGALDELLTQCYTFIFVDRMRSLQAQLTVKPNIDGLVFLNIRHFLHELQREFDPLGFRVFEVVWSAVGACLASGDLYVVDGDPKVRNDTVLAFDPAADPARATAAGLDAWIARVDDELLPDLVTARGKHLDEVVARLAERLRGLRRHGVAVFRFKDLTDPCKDDVRRRWSAILGREPHIEAVEPAAGGAACQRAFLERPGRTWEERESFRALVGGVLAALDRYETTEKNRRHLATLWQYLRLACAADGDLAPEAEAEPEAGGLRGRRRHPGRPSDRTLAELLHIPREQFPQLFATLGRLVASCRAGTVPAPVGPRGGEP